MSKRIKIVLSIIVISILPVFIYLYFPIGFNPKESVLKFDRDEINNAIIHFEGKSYIHNSDKDLERPFADSYLIYKDDVKVRHVYGSRTQTLVGKSFDSVYYAVGDEFIFEDMAMLSALTYYNKNLRVPELTLSDIKKVSFCAKSNLTEHSLVYGASHYGLNLRLQKENIPDEFTVDKIDIENVFNSYANEEIQKLIDANFEVTDDIIEKASKTLVNRQFNYFYLVEFSDSSFPFYLVIDKTESLKETVANSN